MRVTNAMSSWFKARLRRIRVAKVGRIRISTVALVAAFSVLFWVYQTFEPERAAEMPAPAVVPPGFVPDPNYTWVPRTNVRTSQPDATTTTPTSPTETTSPGETTTPTSPSESTPTSPTTTAESPERPETRTTQTPATPAPNTTATGPVARTTGPAR